MHTKPEITQHRLMVGASIWPRASKGGSASPLLLLSFKDTDTFVFCSLFCLFSFFVPCSSLFIPVHSFSLLCSFNFSLSLPPPSFALQDSQLLYPPLNVLSFCWSSSRSLPREFDWRIVLKPSKVTLLWLSGRADCRSGRFCSGSTWKACPDIHRQPSSVKNLQEFSIRLIRLKWEWCFVSKSLRGSFA